MWWTFLAGALASDELDPGCRGRVSARDAELEFELSFDGEDKAVRTVNLRPGGGPPEARGSVQTRLRGRLDALQACYAPYVDAVGGPVVNMLVNFDVEDGRPVNVGVESAFGDPEMRQCVQEVVQQTPMLCKLDAMGFAFPLRFRTGL